MIDLELNIFKKNIRKFIINKTIIANIDRIQAYDWIMCRYFCIGVDFMLKGKSLLEYTNFFSTNDYKNNDQIQQIFFNNQKCELIVLLCL